MTHDITIREDGRAEAMFAEAPGWHRLGTVVREAPDSRAAFKLAGLDWEVESLPMFLGKVTMKNGSTTMGQVVPGHKCNVRVDTGEVLGVVTDQYQVVQNQRGFAFTDDLLGGGDIRYESCGSLRGGRIIWLLARLEGATFEPVEGDLNRLYLLYTAGHDGAHAIRLDPTSTRVVCWNTMQIAWGRSQRCHWIKHTGDVSARVDEAREALGLVRQRWEVYQELVGELLEVRVNEAKETAFLDRVMPVDDQSGKAAIARRQQVMEAFRFDTRNNLPGMEWTAWSLLNAYTQHVDHESVVRAGDDRSRDERRFESNLLGRASLAKTKAIEAIVEVAGVAGGAAG